jgi:hypothetical protein
MPTLAGEKLGLRGEPVLVELAVLLLYGSLAFETEYSITQTYL